MTTIALAVLRSTRLRLVYEYLAQHGPARVDQIAPGAMLSYRSAARGCYELGRQGLARCVKYPGRGGPGIWSAVLPELRIEVPDDAAYTR